MKYKIKINNLVLRSYKMEITFTGIIEEISGTVHPKVTLHFIERERDRRLPLVIQHSMIHEHSCYFDGTFTYDLAHIFFPDGEQVGSMRMYVNILFGDYYEEKVKIDLTPEVMEKKSNAYDIQVCEDHFLIKKISGKDAPPWNHAGLVAHSFSWLLFCIAVILSPVLLLKAVLVETGLFPYQLSADQCDRPFLKRILHRFNENIEQFSGKKISRRGIKIQLLKWLCILAKVKHPDGRTITLMSVRRGELSGNLAFVYKQLKKQRDIRIRQFLCPKDIANMNLCELYRIAQLCASSNVIVLDEYTAYIHEIHLHHETKVIQLWHACGAFKTFGYSRLGKPGGTPQNSSVHRNYSYATVSSESVRIWYAEAFGIPTKQVLATGVPRTDIFFDTMYRKSVRQRLYVTYPILQGKKVILFAPTFRGENQLVAGYPMERFDVGHFFEHIPEEYVLIIKHHPFVKEKHPIPECYADRVLDLSTSSELNDLLFVTDLIITDYSSLVFEASLLDLPMLFYSFDLQEYINSRDFYFDFETFAPGRILYEQENLEKAICEQNFAHEKVRDFAKKFFDIRDGRASERTADLIMKAMKESSIYMSMQDEEEKSCNGKK